MGSRNGGGERTATVRDDESDIGFMESRERRGGGGEREKIRSIVEGGTENIRSKPAMAGLPPWGVILVCMVNAEAMPKFHEWKIKLLRF